MKKLTMVLAITGLAAAGCGKGKKQQAAAEGGAAGAQGGALLAGRAPTLPKPFAKLSEGMTLDAARSAAPELFAGDDSKSLTLPEYPDVRFDVYLDDASRKLTRLVVSLPKDKGPAMIAAAWGPPVAGKDSIDRPQSYWWNPETGLRAVMEEGYGDNVLLNFSRYLTLDALLGDGPDIRFAKENPLFGQTVDALAKSHGAQLIQESAEEAAADRKQIEALAGERLDDLGAPRAHAYLELLPTKWGKYWTRVDLDFDPAGKVIRYRFGLDYEPNQSARDEIFAALTKKWGPGKEGDDLGRKTWTFSENPRISVMDDDISKQWTVSAELPTP